MYITIVGYLPSAEHFIVQLCHEHQQLEQCIKELVNNTDRHNPGKRAIDEYQALRNRQLSIELEAQHLFNNN